MNLRRLLLGLSCCVCLVTGATRFKEDDYWTRREQFVAAEDARAIGGDLVLDQYEQVVNEKLLEVKRAEFDDGFNNAGTFPPSLHFFKAKAAIERSQVFQLIRQLPKGGALHGHTKAMASGEYMFNLTYSSDLFACTTSNGHLKLKFFRNPDTSCAWQRVSDLRANNATYDDYLRSQLTLWVDDPSGTYTDINLVWEAFEAIFSTVGELLIYRPVFEQYLYDVLQEHFDDNVLYVEIRDSVSSLYDLDNNWSTKLEACGVINAVAEKFKRENPTFLGMKLIYSPYRRVTNETFDNYVNTALELKAAFPDLISGFDLVGQEDLGEPLTSFISKIRMLENVLPFYFHSGETNWYGASTDQNLIDAALLGAKRIGHGYALTKHPEVLDYVRTNGAAIEVSPISNQVLMLVQDLRNHPAAMFIANGYPVVICNDDPSFWGAKGLSYDWYLAYMGMTSRDGDLRILKKLAWNSIQYSSLSDSDKVFALRRWEVWWKDWVHMTYTRIKTTGKLL